MTKLMFAAVLIGSAGAISIKGCASRTKKTSARHTVTSVRHAAPRCQTEAGPLTDVFGKYPSVKCQGNTLKTWDIGDETTERVQCSIKSEGRPIHANVELWTTPSYIPTKFACYTEDGLLRPVDAIIETPVSPKTVGIYNTGSIEFPFDANVAKTGLDKAYAYVSETGVQPEKVQGGKVMPFTFGPEVDSVQILLMTAGDLGGRNMKAKIELTQGPNQVKQIFEIYASVGYKNPFYAVVQTPGANNAIRVINENTIEFPFNAWVLPYKAGPKKELGPIMGGSGWD